VSAQADIKVWYDPEQDKYRLYDLRTKKKDTYTKGLSPMIINVTQVMILM
jgi:hypothetical protein